MIGRPPGIAAGASLLVAAAAVFACARASVLPAPRIVIEPAERPGYWRATWELEAATHHLRFARPAAYYRETIWEVLTPGWRWAREGEDQVLVADPESAAARIVAEFPVYSAFIPKEYELFLPFTDGSVAIYTGGFQAAAPGSEDFIHSFALRPPSGAAVVVEGRASGAEAAWEDPDEDGTYVYVGRIRPLETAEMVAILDPGAPRWLTERLMSVLPEMFSLYTARFGEALAWKPVVLFNFVDVERSGYSSGGGTLTGLIAMSAVGGNWRDATPDASEHLLRLIAHEAAHLWNGQLYSYEGDDDSWMHEGSADAFAGIALLGAGALGEARLAAHRTDALERCSLGLRRGSLSASRARGEFRNYYACGELIALWSAAAISEPPDAAALFTLWRSIFEQARVGERSYSRHTYFEALRSLGAGAALVEELRLFVDSVHEDPAAALRELFGQVGIELESLERPPQRLRRDRGGEALRQVMEFACDGRVDFQTEGPRLLTAPVEGCEPFAQEMLIVSIEGRPLGSDGDLALEEASRRCAEGRSVKLGLADQTTVSIPCAGASPAVPRSLGFPATLLPGAAGRAEG